MHKRGEVFFKWNFISIYFLSSHTYRHVLVPTMQKIIFIKLKNMHTKKCSQQWWWRKKARRFYRKTNNKEWEKHVLAIIMMTNIDNLLCIFMSSTEESLSVSHCLPVYTYTFISNIRSLAYEGQRERAKKSIKS